MTIITVNADLTNMTSMYSSDEWHITEVSMASEVLSTRRDSEQSETFHYNKGEATTIYGARATCRREDQRDVDAKTNKNI